MGDQLITYAFCYDDSYARGNPCAALGVRGYDVRITHIRDEGARAFIRQSGGQVIPKLDGYRKADEVKELTRMWVREFGERIPVIALADEPTANGITVAQMVEMAKAIREVTDKPILANLMADAANIAYAFALAPHITYLSTDAYCNANGDCSYVNTEKTVRAAAVWLADVFKAAGMSAERGQGVMFIAQGFRMTRCVGELQARSVVFGDALYEMYLRVFDETLGGLLKGVGIYAWLNEDKTGSDGDMPSLHAEMWPPIKKFIARLDGTPSARPQPLPAGGEKAVFEPSAVVVRVGEVLPVRVSITQGHTVARFEIDPVGLIDGWPAELPPGAATWTVNGRTPGKGTITCILDSGAKSELAFEVVAENGAFSEHISGTLKSASGRTFKFAGTLTEVA